MADYESIKRDQRNLDNYFSGIEETKLSQRPDKGWIRTIREALGMTAEQLGKKITPSAGRKKSSGETQGISGNSALMLERNEAKGSITLDSLERAAEALDCTLVYTLIPKTSLTSSFNQQLKIKADIILSETKTTMSLEDQTYDKPLFDKKQFAEELVKKNSLWD